MLSTALETWSAASRYWATRWMLSVNAWMVGPMEVVRVLRRDVMRVGFMELVWRESRIFRSEGERREVLMEGGWAWDGVWGFCGERVRIEGGLRTASRAWRSDFDL